MITECYHNRCAIKKCPKAAARQECCALGLLPVSFAVVAVAVASPVKEKEIYCEARQRLEETSSGNVDAERITKNKCESSDKALKFNEYVLSHPMSEKQRQHSQ